MSKIYKNWNEKKAADRGKKLVDCKKKQKKNSKGHKIK